MGESDLVRQAARFEDHLTKIKSKLGELDFPWYPYDSLGNLVVVDRLLQGRFRSLLDQPKGARVLDIGCADGDLAFFLESLGFQVIAIDHAGTNLNEMRGVRKLKEALNSKVEILARDLDSRFDLPEGPYELVVVLGILYHLKNPYYLLEMLARHARFCLLSTRVTRQTPDGLDIRDTPIAYLLGPDELNQDCTNYWIFSEAGLKRLIFRTGWEICGYMSAGDTQGSGPNILDHDERAFCLLRNRRSTDLGLTARLVQGWHELEEGRWRWTERIFSVELSTADLRTDPTLELEFVYPDFLKQHTESIQVQARIGDTPLGVGTYSAAGIWVYRTPVLLRLLDKPAVLVKFELNHAIPPDSRDLRERGIIPLSVGFR